MGNGQQFDLVATVKDTMSGNAFQEHRLQFPSLIVWSCQCNRQTYYMWKCQIQLLQVTVTAIINSNYYMSPPSSTTFTIDGSRIGQKIELENEKNNKGGFRPIVISPAPFLLVLFLRQLAG